MEGNVHIKQNNNDPLRERKKNCSVGGVARDTCSAE